jgi:dihydroxyacetone synthase
MHLAENFRPANGETEYGRNTVNGLMKEEKAERGAVQQLTNEQDHVLKSFRLLIADLCQQFNGGHPGYFA